MNGDAQSAGPPDLQSKSNQNTATLQLNLALVREAMRVARLALWGFLSLVVARNRCARLLLAAGGYSKLLGAARIARCHAGGPRYAWLLASLGCAKHAALVSRGRAPFARGCSWLRSFSWHLAAARGCSKLVAGRVDETPNRSALRGYAHGRDCCARLAVMPCRGIYIRADLRF
jgi:hypothetical protein